MLGILGSGFGLYGYLPAAIESGHKNILLSMRYKDNFFSRRSLQDCAKYIHWLESDEQ